MAEAVEVADLNDTEIELLERWVASWGGVRSSLLAVDYVNRLLAEVRRRRRAALKEYLQELMGSLPPASSPPDPSIADAHRRVDQFCHRIAELELKVEHLEAETAELTGTASTPPSSSCSGHGAQGDPATPTCGHETARRDTLSIGCKVEVDTEHGIRLGDLVGFLENGKVAVKMYGQHYAIEPSKLRRHGAG